MNEVIAILLLMVCVFFLVIRLFVLTIKQEREKNKSNIIIKKFELNKIKKDIFLLKLERNEYVKKISEEIINEERFIDGTWDKVDVKNIQIQYNNAIITICYEENGFDIKLITGSANKNELKRFIKDTRINTQKIKRVLAILGLLPVLVSSWVLGMATAYKLGIKSDGLIFFTGGIFFIIAVILYYKILKYCEKREYEYLKQSNI